MADFFVSGDPSMALVRPVTPAAKAWTAEHVQLEGWQWLGPAFGVEHRYLDHLLVGIETCGLTVEFE